MSAALIAVLGVSQASAAQPSAGAGRSTPFYVLTKAKGHCRAHYTKQTVTVRVRRHRQMVRIHQLRCVYAASRSSLGPAPSFPTDLPTAAVIVNVIPNASSGTYTIAAGHTLNVAGSVLQTDAGSGLAAVLVAGTSDGALALNRNGTFRYTPDSGFSGVDGFTYKVVSSSGESSTPAAVTIYVKPVAVAGGAYDVAAAGTLTVGAPGVLSGAVGSNLRARLVSDASGGSLTLSADGSFGYTPAPGFSGRDSFTFDAVDAATQASGPVTVTVNVAPAPVVLQPPSLVPHAYSGTVGNTELQVGGTRGGGPEVFQGGTSLLAGDGDPNGGTLSVTPASSIPTVQGGSVTLAPNGTFTYQPPAGFVGPSPDNFNYRVNTSEGTSAQASATINFNGGRVWYVNNAPSLPPGNGTSAAPFNSLAAANGKSGDEIFVFSSGTPYSGGVTLGATETLVGQPAGLTITSETLLTPSGVNPLITNAGGPGVTLAEGDVVRSVNVGDSAGAGVSATGVNSFTLDPTVSITNNIGDGLHVSGGSGAASIGAQITTTGTGGHSVSIQNRTGGVVTLSGTVTDHGNGVLVASDAGTTINFTGPIIASTANANSAFAATGGGTVSTTNATSALSTTTATALDVGAGTRIGSAGLTFQSISAGTPSSGPVDGVLINGSGTAGGGLTVLGTGSAGSGGTIENATGTGSAHGGVSVTNSGRVSLSDMSFIANAGAAVHASVVPSFSMLGATVTGGGSGIVGDDGGGLLANSLFAVNGNTLNGLNGTAVSLSYAGAVSGSVNDNTIGNLSANSGSLVGDGIDLTSAGSANATVTHNTIQQIGQGTGIFTQTLGTGVLALNVSFNTVTMGSPNSQNGVKIAAGNGGPGFVCVNPSSNTVTAAGSGTSGILVEQLNPNSTFEIQSYAGQTTDTTAVASYLTASLNNSLTGGPGGQGALATFVGGSTGFGQCAPINT